MKENNTELLPAVVVCEEMPVAQSQPSTLSLIQSVVQGGITSESVGVMERLIAMRRDELATQNKTEFNRAFFALKQEVRKLNLYADKEAKDFNGNVMYSYCSEAEIGEKLEPVLANHGFDMLFSQERDGETVTAVITLLHQSGHEFVSKFTVRVGATNKAKDATAADAGSTTSAWRHLVMKMFGLKSRISDEQDPRNLGTYITPEQVEELKRRVNETSSDVTKFLALAGAASFETIMSGKYAVLDAQLAKKERVGR